MGTIRRVNGLHHITAIAGPAQENLDFYAGVLGMRLVKRSVNQDDPGTYHLFYADAEGHPGTDLTFFPWARDGAAAARARSRGRSRRSRCPPDSLDYWGARLEQVRRAHRRRRDALRRPRAAARRSARAAGGAGRSGAPAPRPFTPWDGSTVPPSARCAACTARRLWERDAADDRDAS